MAIYDLITVGSNGILGASKQAANWVVGTNDNGSKNGLPAIIDNVQKFSDKLTYERCSQFVDEGLDFVKIGGCKPSVQDTLSRYTKASFAARYLNKFTSNVDVIKHKIGNTIENVKNKFGQSYYCTVLAPTFKILLELLEGLIEKPKKILALIYKYLEKIIDITKNLVNRLFACFEAAIKKFKDILDNIKIPNFVDYMTGVSVWSERCEIISGPIVSLFNKMMKNQSVRKILVELGTINNESDDIVFESIQEVNAFMKVSTNLSKKLEKIDKTKDRILNNMYSSDEAEKAELGYKLAKASTQYSMSIVMNKILGPLIRLNSEYNNILHTRSRYLGRVVNNLIGWLFPPKGYSHGYEDNIIFRGKYSIVDVLIICDSLHDCNDYLCGGITNRIKEMFKDLKLNKNCWWMNPLIYVNEYMDGIISGLEKAYTNAFTSTKSTTDTLNRFVDISFIKSIRSFDTVLYTMENN